MTEDVPTMALIIELPEVNEVEISATLGTLRAALHRANQTTPGWEGFTIRTLTAGTGADSSRAC